MTRSKPVSIIAPIATFGSDLNLWQRVRRNQALDQRITLEPRGSGAAVPTKTHPRLHLLRALAQPPVRVAEDGFVSSASVCGVCTRCCSSPCRLSTRTWSSRPCGRTCKRRAALSAALPGATLRQKLPFDNAFHRNPGTALGRPGHRDLSHGALRKGSFGTAAAGWLRSFRNR